MITPHYDHCLPSSSFHVSFPLTDGSFPFFFFFFGVVVVLTFLSYQCFCQPAVCSSVIITSTTHVSLFPFSIHSRPRKFPGFPPSSTLCCRFPNLFHSTTQHTYNHVSYRTSLQLEWNHNHYANYRVEAHWHGVCTVDEKLE
ncbi:hypothetical protein BDV98DRAFT_266629 [Pterulicium gracile]|uniref:Uncharacterized protein n=1 Tax=Pterulicium gracile TaxID=1884261 RepID=A0A5C3QG92_9AGAR|nr:hypothetical protein BDV98DRAFT_266629 [Pterula gracilis]